MESAGLTWVIAAGEPTHVSRFAALAPRLRPRVSCPGCGRRLTLKLGRILRHHAAHAAHARCAATQPETALHLDLKFHIAARLRDAIGGDTPLVVRRACAGAGEETCESFSDAGWLRDWDDVVVEARVGSDSAHRPDILLRRAGQSIAAIEVRVSHAVDERKAAAMGAAGVPWIEVRGDAALLAGDAAWTMERPLPVATEGGAGAPTPGAGSSWGPWRCAKHAAIHAALVADADARHAADAEAGRHRVDLRAARVVDVYHPDGTRDRLIYRVEDQFLDGTVAELVLRCGTREIARGPVDSAGDDIRLARAALRDSYAADVERLTLAGAFTDSPMRWATGDSAANIVHEALFDLAPGDQTPLATRYPRRWFYDRERRRWFMPPETRAVHWDRPDPDAFAAHPAWAESRRKVRERPAPEYAWNTFVFASRPTVLEFGPSVRVTQQGSIAVLHVDGAALVVLTAAAADDDVLRVERSLADAGVEHAWLSHPRDWTAGGERAGLAWAPAGRDGRGRGVVVVDGVGVYRAEQFVRVFARGDRRVTAEAIRARSAPRVAALGAASATGP